MSEWTWLEGRISIEAAIRGNNRTIDAVYIRRGKWDRETRHLLNLAEKDGINIEIIDDAFIAKHAAGKSHGGLLARSGPRHFATLHDLLEGPANPLVVMLDGIEDPFNFGQAVRALYAAGASGLVVRPRNWLSATGTVTRASAGATELMPTAVAESALEAAAFFRERDLMVACTAKKSAISLYEADLSESLFLLIGGEKRGITRSFLDLADLRLTIPYGRSFKHSLGAAASTAIFAFELARQRGQLISPDAT
jgi:23S rRNA (guanosine2251-2'-O)-methyltransferase